MMQHENASRDELAVNGIVPGTVRLIRLAWRDMNGEAWDERLHRSGGSFLGSWPVLRIRRLISRVSLFEFELTSADGSCTTKIAQCAIAKHGDVIVFLDRIHILPEYDKYWSACFSTLTAEVGAHTYFYGSLWNHENSRCSDIRHNRIKQFPVGDIFRIDVIATRRWDSFDEYFRSVSDSIRHDYKRAINSGKLRVEIHRSWRAIRCIFQIMGCRASVITKIGDQFRDARPAPIELILLIAKILLFGRRSLVALAKVDNRCLAAFFGIEFGDRLYHLTGGTKPNRIGAGSLMMLTIVKYLFEEKADGELLLGLCWGGVDLRDYDHGTLLYRRKLRAEAVNGVYQTIVVGDPPAVRGKRLRASIYYYLRR